jgi:Flp pilus assembly protein TadD
LFKTTGDGLLVEFASVVDAVRCAVETQREMATRNVGIPPERRIELRMGINLGDIIVEDGDFFGDGVNIAARLELDPNSFFARGYLGVSYGFGGDYETALPYLEEVMRLSPRGLLLVIWCLCRGWAALTAEHSEEAVEYATQAAEANPEFPDIYAVLACAYGHLGRAVDAREALDQLLRRMLTLPRAMSV